MKNLIFKKILFFIFLIAAKTLFCQPNTKSFTIETNGLSILFDYSENNHLQLISFLPNTYSTNPIYKAEDHVFVQCTGENQSVHHGSRLLGSNPGKRLLFVEKKKIITEFGSQVILIERDTIKKIRIESYYEYNDITPTVKRYTKIFNESKSDVGIDYLSSAILNNFNISSGSLDENLLIHYATNGWQIEGQWHTAKPYELGWYDIGYISNINFSNLGSWSTIRYLPMGMIENTKEKITWFWQIEHNGSWHCEIAGGAKSTYLYLGGPDALHSSGWINLKPGESFQTITVAVGCVNGGFDEAVAALTKYRRTMVIKPHNSYKSCPVIFNDFMNCLFANPTSEKEYPLIKSAAEVKCDYYVIDAGWYAELDEDWWNAVGLWLPSKTRFKGGLQNILDSIKKSGMKTGLWLEPEVVGVNSPLKNKPDNWFLMQHGKRYIDHYRYLLDFRNPEVISYITSVVDRMVTEYGVGYIKMDYNNNIWGADDFENSLGYGLLEHNIAVTNWYKNISNKYPELIIENCASGGCRMDYAMLSNTQIQSMSDQTNYEKYPSILVGELAAVVPEQLGIWACPSDSTNAKEASYIMVSALMCRIILSGNLDKLNDESLEQVRNGIDIYKTTLAPFIPTSVPFFPLGMPSITNTINPISVGLKNDSIQYIAVWRLKGDKVINIPVKPNSKTRILYPTNMGIKFHCKENLMQIEFPDEFMAAIIEVIE